ncbi:MAG: hypothetical protein KGL35_08395 [Bradyrhizobium sp.]|nr:hypothetical protein [Bradyrhizobium sp.]
MAFTDQERVDIRRFCGYPLFGGTPQSFQSYRFFQAYGALEYRLTNLSATEEATLRTIYLTGANNLYLLEQAVFASSANLDTDQAAVWTHNKDEVRDRLRLFHEVRDQLCRFLGVPRGPNFAGNTGSLAMVV